MHSLLGEATDHISEASVSELSRKLDGARSAPPDATADSIRSLLFQIPGSEGQNLSRQMDAVRDINSGPGSKNPVRLAGLRFDDTDI